MRSRLPFLSLPPLPLWASVRQVSFRLFFHCTSFCSPFISLESFPAGAFWGASCLSCLGGLCWPPCSGPSGLSNLGLLSGGLLKGLSNCLSPPPSNLLRWG